MVSKKPLEQVTETLCAPGAHRSPAPSAAHLTRDDRLNLPHEGRPWALVQHGVSAQGVFQVVPTSECEEYHRLWCLAPYATEMFLQDITTVVDYFWTQNEAEQFLTTFAPPLATMLPKVWPASIAEPLRQWYAARKGP
jgi:hypothetical protein